MAHRYAGSLNLFIPSVISPIVNGTHFCCDACGCTEFLEYKSLSFRCVQCGAEYCGLKMNRLENFDETA